MRQERRKLHLWHHSHCAISLLQKSIFFLSSPAPPKRISFWITLVMQHNIWQEFHRVYHVTVAYNALDCRIQDGCRRWLRGKFFFLLCLPPLFPVANGIQRRRSREIKSEGINPSGLRVPSCFNMPDLWPSHINQTTLFSYGLDRLCSLQLALKQIQKTRLQFSQDRNHLFVISFTDVREFLVHWSWIESDDGTKHCTSSQSNNYSCVKGQGIWLPPSLWRTFCWTLWCQCGGSFSCEIPLLTPYWKHERHESQYIKIQSHPFIAQCHLLKHVIQNVEPLNEEHPCWIRMQKEYFEASNVDGFLKPVSPNI